MYAIRNIRTKEIMEHVDTLEEAEAIKDQYNLMGKDCSPDSEYFGTYEITKEAA